MDQQRDARFFAARFDGAQDLSRFLRGVETKEQDVCARFNEWLDPFHRVSTHQVYFKRFARMVAKGSHQIGKQEHALHAMAVGHVELEALRDWIEELEIRV